MSNVMKELEDLINTFETAANSKRVCSSLSKTDTWRMRAEEAYDKAKSALIVALVKGV